MGLGTERYAAGDISRDVQDDLAMKSNQRAAAAIAAGRLADEIVPIPFHNAKATRWSLTPTKVCAQAPPWNHLVR
jgi:acetyl-CoA acetyltransferase